MFSLVRYLRNRNIDAHLLLLNDETAHFHPSCDAFDLDYQSYTIQLPWGDPRSFRNRSAHAINHDLVPYDVLIVCGFAPAFIEKAGRRVDLFVPYGTDVFDHPFITFRQGLIPGLIALRNQALHRAQKRGIKNAACINFPGTPFYQRFHKKLRITDKTCDFGLPMVYTNIYSPEKIVDGYHKSAWYHIYKKIREANELVIFHASRHIWKTHIEYSDKGNDKLIKGFAKFVQAHPTGARSCLILFEYGVDVQASRSLIRTLGIENRVQWLPLMDRKELMIGLSLSDISAGEFGCGDIGGGTVWESLAMGKPVFHYLSKKVVNSLGTREFHPLVNVKTAEDIDSTLRDFCNGSDQYRNIGQKGQEWYENAIPKSLDTYEAVIAAIRSGGGLLDSIIRESSFY